MGIDLLQDTRASDTHSPRKLHGGRTRRAFITQGALAGAGTLLSELFNGNAVASAVAAITADGSLELREPPLRDADYWAFADWLQSGVDRLWNEAKGWYTDDARLNATALATHAIAALTGHQGPTRRDERARRIARLLCQEPPYRPLKPGQAAGGRSPRSPSQRHRPGFVARLGAPHSEQHIAIDSKIAKGLFYAWRARRELELPDDTVKLIEHRINTVAHSRFFRYPNVRLNQINFASELFSCAATITGDPTLMRNDYRRHLARFLRGATHPTAPWSTPNLGPSYSFHRSPFQRADQAQNIESNEYANIVLDVISYYDQARRAGMAPLGRTQLRTLRAWVKRALPAYWTHSGYMNWDTGLYLKRWHLTRYWAWSCQGVLAIATSRDFASEDERGWAKYVFDRALGLYARLCRDRGSDARAPGSTLFGIRTTFTEGPHFELVRFQALAAEAIARGLGGMEANMPPSLYAFDPEIGRLAITTPAYNTAIVGVNNGAFPYGGIELARLYDSRQRVIAHIGGKPPAGMGVVVRNSGSRTVAASQTPRRKPGTQPLVLTKSPRGRIAAGVRYPKNPYAGKFGEIEVAGRSVRNGVTIRTRHRFTADHIELRWAVTRDRHTKMSADAMFPTWERATITALLRDGRTVELADGGSATELSDMRYLFLNGTQGGYVAVPVGLASGASVFVERPPPQPSNPKPGPSLMIRFADGTSWKRVTLAVRIAPATGLAQAAQVAAKLGSA